MAAASSSAPTRRRGSPVPALHRSDGGADGSLLPARADADGTHRRLLEVALQTFGERGFHGVSVRELAKAAGIHPSSMYNHLASKEALLLELVTLGHEEHLARVSAAAPAAAGPVERLTAYVRAHVGLHADFPLLARVASKDLHALSEASLAQILPLREASEQLLLDVITEGVESGQFHPLDPWLAAVMIGGMGMRVSEWWRPDLGYSRADLQDSYADGALRLLGVVPAR